MASYLRHLYFPLFVFFFLSSVESSVITCPPAWCSMGSVPVQFPFRLTNPASQEPRCGYPGFGISCGNRSRTVLTLPGSGDFSVKYIDYEAQTIWLHDRCLPRRLLNFNLSGTPFRMANAGLNLTFFNCSSSDADTIYLAMTQVPCLREQNYTVMYAPTVMINNMPSSRCKELSTVSVSFPLVFSENLVEDIILTWDTPDCKSCLARGGICGLKSGSNSKIGCTRIQSRGLPRSAKYCLIIGVGIPGLLCLIGFACYIGSRITALCQRHHHADYRGPSAAFGRTPEPCNCTAKGLDGLTIESYPKTLLGESRRLPNPSDSSCSICLGEYQSKETLRTIPECNHYFHAGCIDEWLKMNSTCPLCRNSPGGSGMEIPPSLS